MSNFLKLIIAILLLFLIQIDAKSQQNKTKNEELFENKQIQYQLNPGEEHEFALNLKEYNYFELTVNCKGVDVQIELIAPERSVINRVNENSINQVEKLKDVSDKTGQYKISIKSINKTASTGEYILKLVKIEPIDLNNEKAKYILARKIYMLGEELAEKEGGSEEANKKLYEEAIEKYKKSIDIYSSLNDISRVCEISNKIASIYTYYLNQYPNSYKLALNIRFEVLSKYKDIGDDYGQALSFHEIGYLLQKMQQYEKALNYYNQCIAICRNILKDPYEESLSLINIGAMLKSQNKLDESLVSYNKAIELSEKAGFFYLSALICLETKDIYERINNTKMVLTTYDKQVNYYELSGNKKLAADALNSKAEFCKNLFNQEEILDSYQRSLKLYREIEDRKAEATILNNIGGIYERYGEVYKGIDYYKSALVVARQLKDSSLIISILSNLGIVYSSIKDYEKSILLLEESLSFTMDDKTKSVILSNLASTYSNLGESAASLAYYEEALALLKNIKDEQAEAIIINNVAVNQLNTGNTEKAKENLSIALGKFKNTKNKRGQATVLTKLADIELKLGNQLEAKSLTEEALKIRTEILDYVGEIYTRNLLGIIEKLLNNKENAVNHFNKALLLSGQIFNQDGKLITLYNLATLHIEQGKPFEALPLLEESIREIETTRAAFTNNNLQSSYFATNQKCYELYANTLMKLHNLKPKESYDIKAFNVTEQMRARSLLELVANTAKIEELLPIDSDNFKKNEELEKQISYLATQIIKLKTLNDKQESIAQLEEKFVKLKSKQETIKIEIKSRLEQKTENLFRPLSLKEIQEKVLDDETVLLQYFLTEDASYVWVVSKNNIAVFPLPPRKEIENIVDELYKKLTERNNDELESSEEMVYRIKKADDEYIKINIELSTILIDPIKRQLQNKKRLLISPEGKLCLVPFNTLLIQNTKAKSLLEDYEIVNISSASLIALIREKKQENAPNRILVLADPAFSANDNRISKNLNNNVIATQKTPRPRVARLRGKRDIAFARLIATQKEAFGISKAFPKKVDKFTGVDASKQRLELINFMEYYILHFATHSLLDLSQPELSSIVLSLVDKTGQECEGFLTVSDILNLKFSAELVTLSSCQTGLGKEKKGEGVIGLTRAFFYSGAKRVVSTLWSVNDEATADLMVKFYNNIATGLSASSALRKAQLDTLRTQKYKSPYYWGAFQIQGEFK